LQDFAKQVASGNQPGGVVRPERVFQNSEQEGGVERIGRTSTVAAKPPHRSQAEQLAFVKAMTKGT
jgi:hypothetical protein